MYANGTVTLLYCWVFVMTDTIPFPLSLTILNWENLVLPLRPIEPIPTNIAQFIPDKEARLLLLGVTPDYADLTTDVTALDFSAAMIEHVWPGDTEHRRAELGDWRDMPFPDQQFDLAVCDNGFSMLQDPNAIASVLKHLKRVVKTNGTVVARWFLSPEAPLSDTDVTDFALTRCGASVVTLRWWFAFSRACRNADTTTTANDSYVLFDELINNRAKLREAYGWSEDTIKEADFYKGSSAKYIFPTEAAMRKLVSPYFNSVKLVQSGCYPMSEHAPFVVMRNI